MGKNCVTLADTATKLDCIDLLNSYCFPASSILFVIEPGCSLFRFVKASDWESCHGALLDVF